MNNAVEAASRSMGKPSASRIESLVNDIVDSRMWDGQLDECSLTFPQIQDIKASFMFSLTNMLHGRIAYPKSEDQDPQPATTPPRQQPEIDDLVPVAHGAD